MLFRLSCKISIDADAVCLRRIADARLKITTTNTNACAIKDIYCMISQKITLHSCLLTLNCTTDSEIHRNTLFELLKNVLTAADAFFGSPVKLTSV